MCSKVWVTTASLKAAAAANDSILFILYAHFLEQRLTRRRHPVNIYRTKSLLSWPAVYFKAKGPGVFQDMYLPQRAPESLQFPSSCAVFWQASQRGRCLTSQVRVCCFSGDGAPGSLVCPPNETGGRGFGGWWGAARWWYRSAVVRPVSVAKHAHLPSGHTVARKGHSATLSLVAWVGYTRATLVYKGISTKCSHLALIWGCRWGKRTTGWGKW